MSDISKLKILIMLTVLFVIFMMLFNICVGQCGHRGVMQKHCQNICFRNGDCPEARNKN